MSDPSIPVPDEPGTPNPDSPETPDVPTSPEEQMGTGSGDVEADTASGGAPQP